MDLLFEDFCIFDKLMSTRKEISIADTSFIETVVFSARAGIEICPAVETWIKDNRYRMVFFS